MQNVHLPFFQFNMLLITARIHVPPVGDDIIHSLCSGRAVVQRELSVGDLVTTCAFLNVIP